MTSIANSSLVNAINNSASQAGGANSTDSASSVQKTHRAHHHHHKAGGTQAADTQTSGDDTNKISGPAEFFAKLQKLQQADPAKFKEVVSGIAAKLKSAATAAGSSAAGQKLTALADKFQKVADGGDLSQLKPSARPPLATASPLQAYQSGSQQDPQMLLDAAASPLLETMNRLA